MASHFKVSISAQSVSDVEESFIPSTTHGADLRFHGVVRDIEEEASISGIDYTCYESMAVKELERIAEAITTEKNDTHRVEIHHVIGFVPIGVASIIIRVQTKHSAAAFFLCQEYLKRIKATVPIWKRPIFVIDED